MSSSSATPHPNFLTHTVTPTDLSAGTKKKVVRYKPGEHVFPAEWLLCSTYPFFDLAVKSTFLLD